MKTHYKFLLLFLIACSACNTPSEPTVDKPDMARVRRAFRDNYAATDNVEEKRRLANELIDQYAPKLKPSFQTSPVRDGMVRYRLKTSRRCFLTA